MPKCSTLPTGIATLSTNSHLRSKFVPYSTSFSFKSVLLRLTLTSELETSRLSVKKAIVCSKRPSELRSLVLVMTKKIFNCWLIALENFLRLLTLPLSMPTSMKTVLLSSSTSSEILSVFLLTPISTLQKVLWTISKTVCLTQPETALLQTPKCSKCS